MTRKQDVARAILGIFKGQHSRTGYGLPARIIVALSEHEGWSTDETVGGIEYGLDEGWFENRSSMFLGLTDAGLDEIRCHADLDGRALLPLP
ncbi:MAG: hypothetical protein JO121_32365 [Deltaproteobacteria bacterium]|nr:hypothetical protein [Deltaproteobacteria bacterium]